jgi:hypothetical protein
LFVKAEGKVMFDVMIKWQLLLKYPTSATTACKDILVFKDLDVHRGGK